MSPKSIEVNGEPDIELEQSDYPAYNDIAIYMEPTVVVVIKDKNVVSKIKMIEMTKDEAADYFINLMNGGARVLNISSRLSYELSELIRKTTF